MSLCLCQKCFSVDMTEQLSAWLMPELAWPKSLGTSPPPSRRGRGLSGRLTCWQPTWLGPRCGDSGCPHRRLRSHLRGECPAHPAPLAPLRSASQSGRGAQGLGVLSGGSNLGVHGRSAPVLIGFQYLVPDYSHLQLKPPEMLSGWRWGPQHQPCRAANPCLLSCSTCWCRRREGIKYRGAQLCPFCT